MRHFRQNEQGLTLIEVLIALAILSIALTAIVQSASQNIRHTLYLQNRTIATWIGSAAMNTIRAGLIQVPAAPDHLSENNKTFGQSWTWTAAMKATPNPRIKQVVVEVFHQPDDKRYAHLESYVYGS